MITDTIVEALNLAARVLVAVLVFGAVALGIGFVLLKAAVETARGGEGDWEP